MISRERLASVLSLVVTLWTLASAAEAQFMWQPGFDYPVGNGMDNPAASLATFDDGTGLALYAGGQFRMADSVAAHGIAKWNGTNWVALAGGIGDPNVIPSVIALATFDDGSGPALYAGGSFSEADGVPVNNIAKWDGIAWAPVGNGLPPGVNSLFACDAANNCPPALRGLYASASGAIVIWKWDGISWEQLNPSQNITGRMALFNGALYTTGADRDVYKWDGASFVSVGRFDCALVCNSRVLAVFDDGTGEALYFGGAFTSMDGVPANGMAKWNGLNWSALGSGVGGDQPIVWALTVFNNGSGNALYAGGYFTTAGGQPARHVAKWDGAAWSPLGGGVGGATQPVLTLAGLGPALYAGGPFTLVCGLQECSQPEQFTPSKYIGQWAP